MQSSFDEQSIYIPARQAISRMFPKSVQIKVVYGRVWVTLSGLSDDFWLEAGESLLIEARRLVVIEADKESSTIELVSVAKICHASFSDNSDKKTSLHGNWIWDAVRG